MAEGEAKTAGKSKRLGLILGLAALVVGAASSFFAMQAGVLPNPFAANPASAEAIQDGTQDTWHPPVFVAIEPMVISLGPDARARHLRIALKIEVEPGAEQQVEASMPRIFDALNVFLRAVDERDIELPAAMPRLRAQMLRRVELASPPNTVRGVLIQEFILN